MATVEQRLEVATAVLRNIAGPVQATCLDVPNVLRRLDALAAGTGDVADEAFGIAAELREIFAKLNGKDTLVFAGLDIAQGGETNPRVVADMLMPSYLR
jgi:hypothetical protein